MVHAKNMVNVPEMDNHSVLQFYYRTVLLPNFEENIFYRSISGKK